MKRILAAAACCFHLACGGLQVGDRCSPNGAGVCLSSVSAGECRNGILAGPIPCKGPGQCVGDGARFVCDTTRNIAGDGCFTIHENLWQCSVADVRQALRCSGGTWTLGQTCTTRCYSSGGQVFCE